MLGTRLIVLGILSAVLLPPTVAVGGFGGEKQVYLLAGALAGAGLVLVWLRGRGGWPRPVIPVAILAGVVVLAGASGGNKQWLFRFAITAGVLLYGAQLLTVIAPRTSARAVKGLLVGTVPLAVLALYQSRAHRWPFLDTHATNENFISEGYPGRSAGLAGHPLIFGLFMAAMACLALTMALWPWLIVAIAGVIGFGLSGSRSSWLAALIVLLLVFAVRFRRDIFPHPVRFAAFLLILCAVVPVLAINTDLLTEVFSRNLTVANTVSADARINRVQIATDRVFNSGSKVEAFGFGSLSGQAFFAQGTKTSSDTGARTFDNSYITVMYEWGLVGLGALLLALVVALRHLKAHGRVILGVVAVTALFYDYSGWPITLGLLAVAILADTVGRPPAEPVDEPATASAHTLAAAGGR